MTALQKFGTFGILTCGFYLAISRGLHSFFYDLDEERPKRLQQVEMNRRVQEVREESDGVCQRRLLSSFQLPGWGTSSSDSSGRGDDDDGVHYHERKLLMGVSREDMFSVVTDVNEYEAFVPWCQKSVIKTKNDGYMEAELEVGFQMFVERYVSKIRFDFPHHVRAQTGDSNLFSYLDSCWTLQPGPTNKSVWVDFEIDFAFKSALYRQVAHVFLDEVVKKMMGAFENRCREKFGSTLRHRNHDK